MVDSLQQNKKDVLAESHNCLLFQVITDVFCFWLINSHITVKSQQLWSTAYLFDDQLISPLGNLTEHGSPWEVDSPDEMPSAKSVSDIAQKICSCQ